MNNPNPDPTASSRGPTCDICAEISDDFIHVEYGDRVANTCGWPCVIQFAVQELRGLANRRNEVLDRIAETTRVASTTIALAVASSGDPTPHFADEELEQIDGLVETLRTLN